MLLGIDCLALRAGLGLACLLFLMLLLQVAWRPRWCSIRVMGYLGVCGILLVLSLALDPWHAESLALRGNGMFGRDVVSNLFDLFVFGFMVLSLCAAMAWKGAVQQIRGEAYLLIIIVGLGMLLVGGAAYLLIIFLDLELMSMGLYLLPLGQTRSVLVDELVLKFIGPGIIASGIGAYGLVLVYRATGSTTIAGLMNEV